MSLDFYNVVSYDLNNSNNINNTNSNNLDNICLKVKDFEISNSSINFENCLCRKNKLGGLNKQCPNKKYENEIYCEKHLNSKWKCSVFDTPDKKTIDNYIIKNSSENDFILLDTYIKNQTYIQGRFQYEFWRSGGLLGHF